MESELKSPTLRTDIIELARQEQWDWYHNYLALSENGTPKLMTRGWTGIGTEYDKNLLAVTLRITDVVSESHAQIRHDHEYAQAIGNILHRISCLDLADTRPFMRTARFLAEVTNADFAVKHQADLNPVIQQSVKDLVGHRPLNAKWASYYVACSNGKVRLQERDSEEADKIAHEHLLESVLTITKHLWESCDEIKEREYEAQLNNIISDLKHITDDEDLKYSAIGRAIVHLTDKVRHYATNRSTDSVTQAAFLRQKEKELKDLEKTISPFKAAILKLATLEVWDWKQNYIRWAGYLPQLESRKKLQSNFEDVNSTLLNAVSNISRNISANQKLFQGDFELKLALERVMRVILQIVETDPDIQQSRKVIENVINLSLEMLRIGPQTDSSLALEKTIMDAEASALEAKRQNLIDRERKLKEREDALDSQSKSTKET